MSMFVFERYDSIEPRVDRVKVTIKADHKTTDQVCYELIEISALEMVNTCVPHGLQLTR